MFSAVEELVTSDLKGWQTVMIALIGGVTSIILALITLRRTGHIKKVGEAVLEDTQQNGGNSSRDILDRLDRRSLLQEERFTRIERNQDTIVRNVDTIQRNVDTITVDAAATRVQIEALEARAAEGGN